MRDALRHPIAAALATAFIAGTLWLLVDPPSFTGAAGLAAIVLGALGLIVLSAWGAVILAGRRSLSEPEFDALVERTERLAREGTYLAGAEGEFERLVAEAIDRLPEEFRRLLDETPVVVSELGASEGAYGHYFGDTVARGDREDRIVLYRDTLERDFGWDPEALAAAVERTLRHEIAHHLGWNEPGVRSLGL